MHTIECRSRTQEERQSLNPRDGALALTQVQSARTVIVNGVTFSPRDGDPHEGVSNVTMTLKGRMYREL